MVIYFNIINLHILNHYLATIFYSTSHRQGVTFAILIDVVCIDILAACIRVIFKECFSHTFSSYDEPSHHLQCFNTSASIQAFSSTAIRIWDMYLFA
jgi:hypothetical protein